MGRGIRDEEEGFDVGSVEIVSVHEKHMIVRPVDGNDVIEEDTSIPHSQVHDDSEVYCLQDLKTKQMVAADKSGNLVVSAWLARERGWSE
jgi:hypothetical protein